MRLTDVDLSLTPTATNCARNQIVTTRNVTFPTIKSSKSITLAATNQNSVKHTRIKIISAIINSFVPLPIRRQKLKFK